MNIFLKIWLWYGTKLWGGISIYAPNDELVALTFSNSKEYLANLPEIEKRLDV